MSFVLLHCYKRTHVLTSLSLHICTMDELNDSGDDLFITQSTFRVDNVTSQDAETAANFFMDSDDNLDSCIATGDVVEYVDFSNASDKGYTLLSTQDWEEKKKQAAFQPLLPDLFNFMHDKVCFSLHLLYEVLLAFRYCFSIVLGFASPNCNNIHVYLCTQDTDDMLSKVADDLEKQHISSNRFGEESTTEELEDKSVKR